VLVTELGHNLGMKKIATFLQHPLMIGVYTFIAIIISLSVDRLQDTLSLTEIIIGFGGVFLIVSLGIVLTVLLNKLKHQEEFEDKLNDLKSIIIASNMTWLVSEKYVAHLEKHSEETWVFSQDLTNDLNKESEIFHAVEENLQKGNIYKYFIPDTPKNLRNLADYKKLHKYKAGQVEFYVVNPIEYLFYTEIYVYDVGQAQDQKAVEWLPVKALDFYIEMDKDHTAHVIGIGHRYMDRYKAK